MDLQFAQAVANHQGWMVRNHSFRVNAHFDFQDKPPLLTALRLYNLAQGQINMVRRQEAAAMNRSTSKKKIPKRVLRLPDLDFAKRSVLNTLGSPQSKRACQFAIDDFVTWYCSEPRLAFSKTIVLR